MLSRLKSAADNSLVNLKVSEDVATSLQASAAILLKWDPIKGRELPEELAESLDQQRRACAAVLQGKAEVLEFLKNECQLKEHNFGLLIDSQRVALDTLMRKMRSAFLEMRAAYQDQIKEVEESFLAERAELIGAQRREVDGLMDVRRGLEERYVEENLAREEKHSQELCAIQVSDMENYQKLKLKLEKDVMMLEQQLEAIKFTYLLNTGAWRMIHPYYAPPPSPTFHAYPRLTTPCTLQRN